MIRSFRDAEAEKLANDQFSRKYQAIEKTAQRKLIMLGEAAELDDLRSFPGTPLEALPGDRKGQFSIRMNDHFRICFSWKNGNAEDVEIVDYH